MDWRFAFRHKSRVAWNPGEKAGLVFRDEPSRDLQDAPYCVQFSPDSSQLSVCCTDDLIFVCVHSFSLAVFIPLQYQSVLILIPSSSRFKSFPVLFTYAFLSLSLSVFSISVSTVVACKLIVACCCVVCALCSGSDDYTCVLYDTCGNALWTVRSATLRSAIFHAHSSALTDSVVVASDWETLIRLYAVKDGAVLATLEFQGWNRGLAVFDGVALSTDGRTLKERICPPVGVVFSLCLHRRSLLFSFIYFSGICPFRAFVIFLRHSEANHCHATYP